MVRPDADHPDGAPMASSFDSNSGTKLAKGVGVSTGMFHVFLQVVRDNAFVVLAVRHNFWWKSVVRDESRKTSYSYLKEAFSGPLVMFSFIMS